MTWTRSLNKYDGWVFNSFPMTPEALGVYRIIYCLYVLLISGIPEWTWISEMPNDIYTPPPISIASFFSGFPGYYFLLSLTICLGLLYVVLLFGYKTKIVSILVSILYIVGNSFLYSRGKIDHTDLLLVLIPLIMAFSNWGARFSIDSICVSGKKQETHSWPVTFIALIMGFAYFSAGLPKLLGGWLNPSTHAVKGILYSYYYSQGHQSYLAPFFITVQSDLFWELLDYLTVFYELSFLFVIFLPTVFRTYIYFALSFHLMVLLMLNITFTENMVAYLLFINWPLFLNFLSRIKLNRFLSQFATAKSMVLFGIIVLFYYSEIGSSPLSRLLMTVKLPPPITLLTVGLLLATLNVYFFLKNYSKSQLIKYRTP